MAVSKLKLLSVLYNYLHKFNVKMQMDNTHSNYRILSIYLHSEKYLHNTERFDKRHLS